MVGLAKFLHLLGLMLGAAGGIGAMVVARQMRLGSGQPVTQLAALRPVLARVALAGVVLLWASGLWLWVAAYRGQPLGVTFHAKLAVAALLLAVSVAIPLVHRRALSRGMPPPPWLPVLGMTTAALTLAAAALAVATFE